MTKETLVDRLRRTMQEEEDELSPEEREELFPKRDANFDWRAYILGIRKNPKYVPEGIGIDVFEEDEKIQQEQIDRWLSHHRVRGKC